MKRFYPLFLFFFFTCSPSLNAQVYGNEWINFSQRYFKIKMVNEGIYRVDYTTLVASGVPVSTIDPRKFQVFIKGQEQFIHIAGEADGVFNTTDYIEFYGYRNDCSFDSSMYTGIAHLPNPFYSVVQDTLAAFLTWNNSVSNKRYTLETDTAFSGYASSPFFYNYVVSAGNTAYYDGGYNSIGAHDPRYASGEGRCFPNSISMGTSQSTILSSPNAYAAGPAATIVSCFNTSSRDDGLLSVPGHDHHMQLEWKNNSGNFNLFADSFCYGFKSLKIPVQISPSAIGSSTEIKISSVTDAYYTNSNSSLHCYSSIWYPQTFNLAGKTSYKMFIPDAVAQSKVLADFSNFSYTGGALVKAFDLSNGKMVYPIVNLSSGKFLLPNSGSNKEVLLTSTDNDIVVNILIPVNGNGIFTNYMASPADSAFVIVTHKKFMSEALQYASYKQSIAGGSFQTLVADIDDLYDQFAYGIEKHPKSIRNFSKFLLDSFPSNPKYLFLIAKSTYANRGIFDPTFYNLNYVPSYGLPPSDNMLTAGLNGTALEPAIPVGRLSATTKKEVTDYLDKVMQHDTVSPALWQKNVQHFVGGTLQIEQLLFNSYMSGYKNIAQDTFFGGNVTTYIKNTSAPIQLTIAQSVIDQVNSGVTLMTFYGHGSNQSFDFNLNDPGVYDNKGKYPVLLSNSCYTGDVHTKDTMSLSEQYVRAKEKGAIAFLGSVSIGVAQFLQHISSNFYTNMCLTNYGKGIGDILKGAIFSTQYGVQSGDSIEKLTCMEMTLQGDPSLRLNLYAKPDYKISNADLYFNTALQVDSIQVNLRIENLARATNDSFYVRISRTFPDGSITNYIRRIKAPFYCDTLSFFIPVDQTNGPGLNYFSAQIDYLNEIDELDNFLNNKTNGSVQLLINGRDIVPVYPYEFEVVPLSSTIRLKASTSDPFAPARNYVFQLDTTDSFTNPIASTIVNAAGGVVEWAVNLNLPDSTVYFWRVSRDSIDTLGYNWRESSFQTIANKYGWGQAHFFQYKKDGFRYVQYDKPARLFRFVNTVNHIHVNTGIYNFWGGGINDVDLIFNYNSSPVQIATGTPNGWSFFVIDSVSGDFDLNMPVDSFGHYEFGTGHQFGGTGPIPYYNFGAMNPFSYPYAPNVQDSMADFLNNIPPGKYLLGYTNNYWRGWTFPQPDYPTSLYTAFSKLGLDTALLRATSDSVPVGFLGKKNIPASSAHMEIGLNRKAPFAFQDSIVAHWDNGTITSPLIGPSLAWHSIHWRYTSLESNSKDSVVVNVYGVKPNGQEDLIFSLGEDSLDVLNLSSVISATTYPYLRLRAEVDDDVNNTAPQLKRWQVLFDPAPEGAVNPVSGFAVVNDTLQEGDILKLKVPFKNISEFNFPDSLVVSYRIEDDNHVMHNLTDKMKKSGLQPDSVLLDTIAVNTLGYPGLNALWIEFNGLYNTKHQPEEFHFNNIVRVPFGVNADIINPILDVTFDGVHILNGDIVSARPQILVTLKDENLFLALNDTADFELYLRYPGTTTDVPLSFASTLTFTPASLPNNSCKIEFKPSLATDGIYLLTVKAKDRSSNQSGASSYKIQFEVVNKPSVTHIMNYPNPFSTKTKFVFTLTGFEVPETFMIQIMTITGKVVREIKQEELGFIHIGRNITEYAWDGKDEYGDLLANGVYLYRVVTRLNGEAVELRESGADQFFTKEIGKMVIIR